MKRSILLYCLFALSPVHAQLSGTITVGIAGDYADLSAAFAAINTNGVSGTLVVSLLGNFTEPGTTALTRGDLSVLNSVLIRPAPSTTPVVTVSSTNGIDINGASYVTINGSNSGGTSRDLSIRRSSTVAGSALAYLHGGGNTITIKNCVLGDATNTPDYALRVEGPSSVVIENNEIHGIGNANGILYFSSVNGAGNVITGNTLTGDQSGGSKAFGVNLAGGSGSMTVSGNKIHVLKTSGSGGISGIRELMAAGSLHIVNNFIGGGFISTGTSNYFLIDLPGAASKTVYHNTLVMNSIAGSPFDAAGFYIQDGTGNLRSNIIVNNFNDIFSYCIFNSLASTGNLVTNYNNLYAPGINNSVGYDGISTYETLTDWQAWTGVNPDPNSASVSVNFVNAASDFHLTGGSNGDTQLRGFSGLASNDIDGDLRLSNPDGPYMGADEGTSALPVQLGTFAANADRLRAHLMWTTITEVDNHGFEIDRRSPGGGANDLDGWDMIAFVRGAGTSNSPNSYSFTDHATTPGRYAYRLRQIDRSGRSEVIGSLEVEIGTSAGEFKLDDNYPNPFNPATTLTFSVEVAGMATLRVYNLLGQQVAELFHGHADPGKIYRAEFEGSFLPTGVYIASLQSGGHTRHLRMVLAK